MKAKKTPWVEQSDGYLDRTPVLQFILVTILFAMWAISSSLNDILITQFKAVFNLSDLRPHSCKARSTAGTSS